MCGICGVYNNTSFTQPEHEFFEKLLFLNVLRGEHSTGVIRVDKSKKVQTRKSLLASPEFIKHEMSDIIKPNYKGTQAMALLGHCRHATQGAVTLANAHPFGFDRVVGMHNGTIRGVFEGRKDYDTDTEALYKLINDKGLEEALNIVESKDAAYALQWIDKKDRTLNFIKNDDRPLHFTYIYGGTTLIWSSEQAMLELVVKHKKMNSTGWKGSTTDRIFTLHKHDHLQIKLGERADTGEITPIKVEEKKSYTSYSYPSTTTSGTSSQGSMRTGSTGGKSEGQTIYKTGGRWEMTPLGYQWVPSKNQLPIVLTQETPADTKSQSSTGQSGKSTATTSGSTKSTSNGSSPTSGRVPSTKGKAAGQGGPAYKGFREAFGHNGLRGFDWLTQEIPSVQTSESCELPWDDDIVPINKATKDLDDGDKLAELFATHGTSPEEGDEHTFAGYEGAPIRERNFRRLLQNGCSCCGTTFSLDDPHDFGDIADIKWWDSSTWFCDKCYQYSEGDWVKHSVDDTWDQYVPSEAINQ